MSEKTTVEYRTRRCTCQMRHVGSKPCQNLTHWFLMPKDIAICRTCAIFLATNNCAENNAPVLAPMIGTSMESWKQPVQQ